MKTSYEEYLRKYHMLTYKNVGVSMLPLLKQGRDSFTVREVKQGESCKLWDVVLYKRGTEMRLQSVLRKREKNESKLV